MPYLSFMFYVYSLNWEGKHAKLGAKNHQTSEFFQYTWNRYLMLGYVSARIPSNTISNLKLQCSWKVSVSHSSEQLLWVRVLVRTKLLPNWQSRLSMHRYCQFRYGSMQISQSVWIGMDVSWWPRGSIIRFLLFSCFCSLMTVSCQNHTFSHQ
jgi:hypothetical protein